MNRISQNRVRRATIIVAAGKGTRIGELTCTRPKSTLRLNGLSIISRTCELILEISEQIIVVAGKNALCLHEELSWIAEDKLVVVDTPELSEQGCSASMRAGLQALSSEILEVLIIEGDLVLTRDAVRKMLEAEGKIKIDQPDRHARRPVRIWLLPRPRYAQLGDVTCRADRWTQCLAHGA